MLAVGLVRLALFLAAPLDAQIGLIPDDAFYYLVPARHFAEGAGWTFDGVAPSTGFHLLYGYALAGLFRLWPSLAGTTLFGVSAGAGTLLFAAAAGFTARAAAREFGAAAALGVFLAFAAPVALRQPTLLVESCLVLFFGGALLALLQAAAGARELSPRWLAAALVLGLLGNLARSDFGLVPAAAALVFAALGRRAPARVAAAATLGALFGVLAVSLHTLYWSGSLVQSSARMKHHWSELLGYDPRGLVRWLVDVVSPRDASWLGARSGTLLVLAAGAIAAFARLGPRALRLDRWPLALASLLAVLGYVLFYGEASSGVPPWYLANALPACAFLMGGVTSFLPRRALVPAAAVAAACAALDVSTSLRPFLPHQAAMLDAGLYLRDHPELGLASAWNAGVVAYFSGRPVVNLDGLVNDEIYPAATSGKLLDYMCRRGVRAVVDYEEMVRNPELALRGGHSDGKLHALLRPERNFTASTPNLRWHDSDLWLWRLDASGCAAAASGTSE